MGTGFCGACGSPLKEGAKFCAGCGAPTAANGAEAQGGSPQPGAGGYRYSQNNNSYQYPVKKKSSNSVVGIIVVLVLVLAAAFGVIKLFKINIPGINPLDGGNSGKPTVASSTKTDELNSQSVEDNSGKDVTLKELSGQWTGTMQYNDIKNLDKIPDITEDEIKTTREMFGDTLPFSISIDEAGLSVLTVTGVDGSQSDIAELPAIVLKDGKFTVTLEEDNNKFVFNGVVTEKGTAMNLDGEMTMSLDAGDGTMVTFVMSYSVSK
jgi:hypothetical protein